MSKYKKLSKKEKRRQEKKARYTPHQQGKIARKKAILIITEGESTEPSYFKHFKRQFRMSKLSLEVKGVGQTGLSLISKAENIAKQGLKGEDFSQVWCVFDADPNPSTPTSHLKKFDEAVKEAKEKGFRVALSHQAFEYWLILHFKAHQGQKMPRKDYNKIINDELKKYDLSYDGKGRKEVSRKFFEWLIATPDGETQSRMDTAIERAKKIHKTHKDSGTPPSQWESCTTVYELVEELLKYKEH
jgi:hypothetical protein